jgi:uncharacterized YkwD family protein
MCAVFFSTVQSLSIDSSSLTVESRTPAQESIVGIDRYETAVKISQRNFARAKNIFLISSDSIPDSVSSTSLAEELDSPILLSDKDVLGKSTLTEIQRLNPSKVYLVGGTNSIGTSVEKLLKSLGYRTERIAGSDRCETSYKLAAYLNNLAFQNSIAIANAESGILDAISFGPISAKYDMPIFLQHRNDDFSKIKDYIKKNNISTIYVLGDKSNLPSEISSLDKVNYITGETLNDINAKINDTFYKEPYIDSLIVVKDGNKKSTDLADALSVGVMASKENSPILMVGDTLSNSQISFLKSKRFNTVLQVGGSGNEDAISDINLILLNSDEENNSGTNEFTKFYQEILKLVNQERRKAGLKSVVFDLSLSEVASLKSQDMADNGYFNHISPTYGSAFDMLRANGISYSWAGENIAVGQKSPEQVMRDWMNSPTHKDNILMPQFERLGIGIAANRSGRLYWTQIFTGESSI